MSHKKTAEEKRETRRLWEIKNKQKRKETARKSYQKHKEQRREDNKKWVGKNKEYVKEYHKEYHKEWYARNKQRLDNKNTIWQKNNKIAVKKIRERYNKNNSESVRKSQKKANRSANGKFRSLKWSARQRGYEVSITIDMWKKIIENPCIYCGDTTNIGVDRRVNEIGYTENNSVPCCTMCNMMKKNYTLDDFLSKIKKIYNYNN
jgi:hypothetical protein